MMEALQSFITNVQNNQLILLLFSGGVIWTLLANIQNIFGTIWSGVLACISFTVNSVSLSEYDVPILNIKMTKILSESKVLWERHTELQPATGDYNSAHLTNSAFGRSYRWLFGHFMILDRTYSTQSTKVVTTITARVFFANRKKFIARLMSEIEKCDLNSDNDTITVSMGKGIVTEKPKRSIDSVYSNDNVAHKILDDVKTFIDNRQKYIDGNSPYKFVALLTGKPGTGKTSVIHAIASELGMGVRFVNTDDEEFDDIARLMTRNSEYGNYNERNIIVFEDVDCMGLNATHKRIIEDGMTDSEFKEMTKIEDGDDETLISAKKELALSRNNISNVSNISNATTISLSSILNLLDGIITPSGSIVFLTSNNPEKLDKALLRDGRIDSKYEFDNFSPSTANKLINDYLGYEIDNLKDNISPSSLQRDVMKVSIGRMTKEELTKKYST